MKLVDMEVGKKPPTAGPATSKPSTLRGKVFISWYIFWYMFGIFLAYFWYIHRYVRCCLNFTRHHLVNCPPPHRETHFFIECQGSLGNTMELELWLFLSHAYQSIHWSICSIKHNVCLRVRTREHQIRNQDEQQCPMVVWSVNKHMSWKIYRLMDFGLGNINFGAIANKYA